MLKLCQCSIKFFIYIYTHTLLLSKCDIISVKYLTVHSRVIIAIITTYKMNRTSHEFGNSMKTQDKKKKFNYPKKRNATEVFFGFVFLPFPLTISFLGNFQCFKMLKTKHTKLDLYILFFSWEMTTKILNIYLQDYVNQIKFKTELWKHFFFYL